MSIKKFFAIFFIISSIFNNFLFAENEGLTNPRTISLENFISLATQKNPEFELILIEQLKLKYNRYLKMPGEELLVNIKTDYSFKSEENVTNVGLTKLFSEAGLTANAAYEYRSENRDGFIFQIEQSLLKNAFGRANRLKLEDIEVGNKMMTYEIIEAYENYIATLIHIYYDFCNTYSELELAKSLCDDSVKLNQNMKDKKGFSAVKQVDLNKSFLEIVNKKEKIKNLEIEFTKINNLIIQAIRGGEKDVYSPDLNSESLDIDLGKINIDFLKEYQNFKNSSRTYFIYDLMKRKNILYLEIGQDDLMDILNLRLGYKDYYEESYFAKEFFVGATFEKGFFDKKTAALEEVLNINYKKTNISIENQKYNIQVLLKNLYENIMLQKELIKYTDEKRAYMEQIAKDDTEAYATGKGSYNDMIKSVNMLEGCKYEKIARVLAIKKMMIDWKNITDQLVKNNELFKGN